MDDKIIEIDADGVLINMDGSYTEHVIDIIPDFSEEKYVTDWGFPLLKKEYPEARERIFDLYKNPDFIKSLPRYENVVEGLKKLSFLLNFLDDDYKILIHTHMRGKEVAKARREWLYQLKEDAEVDFDIKISSGIKKDVSISKFCSIEDNIDNLKRSKAKYKILMQRCHNRKYGLEDINIIGEGKIVQNFLEAVEYIEEKIGDNIG
jgi:5'(3')-deoxyribonucleotidase